MTTTGGLTETVTLWAGATLLVELYRKVGVEAVVERTSPRKKSPKGLRQGQMVESFALLSALGGDCIEDEEGARVRLPRAILCFPSRLLPLLFKGDSKKQLRRGAKCMRKCFFHWTVPKQEKLLALC